MSLFLLASMAESMQIHVIPSIPQRLCPIIFIFLFEGISTMFAFLMGCLGAELTMEKVVALGIAQLVAGAMGMGMGNCQGCESILVSTTKTA